jgi:predicted outer membrane protein/sporulation protein YlmC with PRC-barrel domain
VKVCAEAFADPHKEIAMTRSLRLLTLTAATALASLAASQSQAAPAAPSSQPGSSSQANQQKLSAASFTTEAANGNLLEIQSSELAASQSHNDQVNQFAQRMIQDHSKAADRLKSIADNVPTDLDQQHAKTLADLRNSKGPQFDRQYVQLQVTAHRNAIQLYQRYAQNGDDKDLKQFANVLLPTLRDHLQMAKKLSGSLPPDRVGANQSQNGQQAGQDGQASQIVVQQEAPTIQVEQASPVVSVQQPQPQVTVHQQRPQITVKQPQPTVTIDIPQPEITVRMPRPDVNVAMAQPQVEVNQPKPQVRIETPPQQPQVQVNGSQPQVQVTRATGQPQVEVQRSDAQPEIRYEREQPRVVVSQPQGQPKVRYETAQAGSDQAGGQAKGQTTSQATDQTAQPSQQSAGGSTSAAQANQAAAQQATDASALRDRINAGDTEATGSVASGASKTRTLSVSALENMNVYNAKGDELGDIDRVIVDGQGKKYLVIGNGGFWGIGRDRVAFPLDRFWAGADRVVIRGVTEQDIENMDNYKSQFDTMKRLPANDRADLRIWK